MNDDLFPEVTVARTLLPAWFVERMMTDVWSFGLKLDTGEVVNITHINAVKQAADRSLWLDVDLALASEVYSENGIYAPTSRTTASIAVAHIVMAYELADT